jgi:hypothetical protein
MDLNYECDGAVMTVVCVPVFTDVAYETCIVNLPGRIKSAVADEPWHYRPAQARPANRTAVPNRLTVL